MKHLVRKKELKRRAHEKGETSGESLAYRSVERNDTIRRQMGS